MMRRIIATISLALLLLAPALVMAPTATVGAVEINNGICTGKNDTKTNAGGTDFCKERAKSGNPVVKAIRSVILILSVIIGISAVVVIILSGFKMVHSNGNSQDVEQARNGIIYAAIGLIIAVVAPIIVGFVLSKL